MIQLSRACGVALLLALAWNKVLAQSADWQAVIWREPQVRYLLADLTLNGGKTELYRKYATEERYWSNKERMIKSYTEKPADKRPVWVSGPTVPTRR